jgi:uncharacterized RDD family membrane protein YckC
MTMETRAFDGEIIVNRLDDVRLYEGVRTRRVFAFLMDYVIVLLLMIPFAILVALLGLFTLGLGWMLFSVLFPAVALVYVWSTLGGPRQATSGMQAMSIRLERLDGGQVDGMLAVVHTVLFWAGNVVLSPLILLATLFLDRKRTVHDLLLGTVVVRSDR